MEVKNKELEKELKMEITAESKELFEAYAKDADNWSGNPWVTGGNVRLTKGQRGNLSHLKKLELVDTECDEEFGEYIIFTEKGVEYAKELEIDLSWVRVK